jgi:hypothetical protein
MSTSAGDFLLAIKEEIGQSEKLAFQNVIQCLLQECLWILWFASTCISLGCFATPVLHAALLKELILFIFIQK